MRVRTSLAAFALLLPLGAPAADEPQVKPGGQTEQALEAGVVPADESGRPLNLGFEAGDLRDWKATGMAFKNQPIKGDTVFPRRQDTRSEHQGQFWVGTYEHQGDAPQGTLTSVPFKVTHPFASFLIGGGPHDSTCVELVVRQNNRVFFRASGAERENMHRVAVDLRELAGKEIFIRVVDRHEGHWGHVNFDDFRFHQSKPKLPASKPADLLEFAGLSPDEAARAMSLPEGFRAVAFAGEPDVRQPIAMTIDDRGRLWVAEAYAYPVRVPDDKASDRILIFEDTDGDGKHDKRSVFAEKLNLVSGLEVGFGGVFVGAAPNLLFIPDRDQNDKPDGPAEVLLDGWAWQDTHETLNSFIWGPDGWLYGCHGVFTHSRVGKPGTPDELRIPINAGIWRYHPTRRQFEVFAWGTSNPWGVDFNDRGHCFLTCCVIPHLFHVIQGARYHRQGGQHFQQHTYEDIQTIARHRHWVGNQWNEADRARSDESGGGHAHAGAMIYLGDAWPAQYRDKLFMNNIHGARLNLDRLTPRGSGYLGDGEPDFCRTNDLWSQILYLRYGPDGNVFMIDWYDRNQCHHGDVNGHDRSNGRIFKIVHGQPKPVNVDLRKLSDAQLVELQLHANDWYVRHARRLLQERAAAGRLDPAARQALAKIAFRHADVTRRLRGLWALHVTGGLSDEQIDQALHDDEEDPRAWAIQLAFENGKPRPALLEALMSMARADPSPVVRLYIASALLRISPEQRWDALTGLLAQVDDAFDHNLPLMYWYAAEPLADVDRARALALAASGNIPQILEFMIRRVASDGKPESLELLIGQLAQTREPADQLTFLRGIQAALSGRRSVPMPKVWPAAREALDQSASAEVRKLAGALAITFGDPQAFAAMRAMLADAKTPADDRRRCLAALLNARDKALLPILKRLVQEPAMRADALRALAAYDDEQIPALVLQLYPNLSSAEKRDALATLCSRSSYAKTLLEAIGGRRLPAADLTADFVRQLRNLKSPELDKQIEAVWGTVRDTPEEKARLIAQYRDLLTRSPAAEEELPRGRALFAKICQQCHTLFGAGGKVGPELTGSNRANLDYLLSNVLDPSAVLAREYTPRVILTSEGRVITGLVREETKRAVTVVTENETFVIPREEIEEMKPSDKSMMPDDLLKALSEQEVRALVGYLASPRQVPQLATAENATSFFNGKDLTGWEGNPELWRVENGEIVGTSQGLNRNEFLANALLLENFRLSFDVRLTPNSENSGVQFRSELLPGGEVKGYQADIGAGWWGKLYEEHGRGLIWEKSGEPFVKVEEWNRYEILAIGSRLRTFINGKLSVDLDDPEGARRGITALQLHAGGAMEVRFRNFRLELDPQPNAAAPPAR
jgi:putative membrane-bound dehydrogenase-like protein